MNVARYSKFIVAVAGLFVALGLIDEEGAQEIAAAVTALLVYLVPNSD